MKKLFSVDETDVNEFGSKEYVIYHETIDQEEQAEHDYFDLLFNDHLDESSATEDENEEYEDDYEDEEFEDDYDEYDYDDDYEDYGFDGGEYDE